MIYLDYAAATPVSKKVRAAMDPFFEEQFFNPSAIYLPAKKVREIYEKNKSEIAHLIGAKAPDIIITSGSTEATNLAFTCLKKTSKVLVLATEHASVLNLAKTFDCELINVKKSGIIDLNDFKKKLNKDVELVSVALANNELGTIQPLAEIAEIIKQEKTRRLSKNEKLPLYFHSDASQALNLIDINVARLGVDLLTFSAAKIYGPKGVGALYVNHGVKLQPITYGGGQENNLRSGTENVPAVAGFAKACEEVKDHQNSNRKKYENLRNIFVKELSSAVVSPKFLFDKKHSLSNFAPVSFPGLDAERLIFKLEDHGVLVSTGAACAANKGSKSHVLQAIGLSDEEIAGSMRISMGAENNTENILEAAKIIKEVVKEEYERLQK